MVPLWAPDNYLQVKTTTQILSFPPLFSQLQYHSVLTDSEVTWFVLLYLLKSKTSVLLLPHLYEEKNAPHLGFEYKQENRQPQPLPPPLPLPLTYPLPLTLWLWPGAWNTRCLAMVLTQPCSSSGSGSSSNPSSHRGRMQCGGPHRGGMGVGDKWQGAKAGLRPFDSSAICLSTLKGINLLQSIHVCRNIVKINKTIRNTHIS